LEILEVFKLLRFACEGLFGSWLIEASIILIIFVFLLLPLTTAIVVPVTFFVKTHQILKKLRKLSVPEDYIKFL
jgi:hypothetical protein